MSRSRAAGALLLVFLIGVVYTARTYMRGTAFVVDGGYTAR